MPETHEVTKLPTLSDAANALLDARRNIHIAEAAHARVTLPDYVQIGVSLLIAQAHHAIPNNGKRGNQHRRKEALAQCASASQHDPKKLHKGGFLQWLATSQPNFKQRTAYKYMDAAKGCGLTEYSTPEEVRETVAKLLEAHEGMLTLGSLVKAGQNIGTSEQPTPTPVQPKQDDHARIVENIERFTALGEQLQTEAAKLHPKEREVLANSLKRTLETLTGASWGPQG